MAVVVEAEGGRGWAAVRDVEAEVGGDVEDGGVCGCEGVDRGLGVARWCGDIWVD